MKGLLQTGIQPDVLVCRTERPLPQDVRRKLALFCNISENAVIQNITADTIYDIPLIFEDEGLPQVVCKKLSIECGEADLDEWRALVDAFKYPDKETTIAIAGKDAELHDSYLSVCEALFHAGIANRCRINVRWVDTHDVNDDNYKEIFDGVDGIVSPGGFGEEGSYGQVLAAKYARESGAAFLGIGLGMETAVIEFARNVCGIEGANSSEFDAKCGEAVVFDPKADCADDHMKRGARETTVKKGSRLFDIYKEEKISERHWHMYEVNPKYAEKLEKNGLSVSGVSAEHLCRLRGNTVAQVLCGSYLPPAV